MSHPIHRDKKFKFELLIELRLSKFKSPEPLDIPTIPFILELLFIIAIYYTATATLKEFDGKMGQIAHAKL